MPISSVRLNLYAIISSIEEDLRDIIINNLENADSLTNLLGEDLYSSCIERFDREVDSEDEISLSDLIHFTHFGDLIEILCKNKNLLQKSLNVSVKNTYATFTNLVPIRNKVMHNRPIEFEDYELAIESMKIIIDNLQMVNTKITIDKIDNDPSFVFGLDIEKVEDDVVSNNLPTAEFDETGFIGRKEEVDKLVNFCKTGTFPVISIVGEGGIGKTALALKVAYDILDDPESQFEAIIWTSSKTLKLTKDEIQLIEDAIKDSFGIFQELEIELSGQKSENSLEEVLNYLEEFKILLILDNLETVMDDQIKDFISRLPNKAKVIITSRIGLGAYEYPFKISGLKPKESVLLLRTLSKIRGVSQLYTLPNNQLEKYCSQMNNNPGFIKWFVSAVHYGKRPEDILDNPKLFLKFCMDNVYEHISGDGKVILNTLLCLPEAINQAELAYYTDFKVHKLQEVINELISTNMLKIQNILRGNSYETIYSLTETSHKYLQSYIKKDRIDIIRQKQISLIKSYEKHKSIVAPPLKPSTIHLRSKADSVVVKYLTEILKEMRRKKPNLELCDEKIEEALRLAPDYFEVKRIEAFLRTKQGFTPQAKAAFEASLSLEPNAHHVHFHYGRFLMRQLNDSENALTHYNYAKKKYEKDPLLNLELSRLYLYMGEWDVSRKFLHKIKKIVKQDRGSLLRRWNDQYIQTYVRFAEWLLYTNGDAFKSFEQFNELKTFLNSISLEGIDRVIVDRVKRSISCIKEIRSHISNKIPNSEKVNEATGLIKWYHEFCSNTLYERTSSISKTSVEGTISYIDIHKGYGFIELMGSIQKELKSVYFNRGAITNPTYLWSDKSIGKKVSCFLISASKGPAAIRVTFKE